MNDDAEFVLAILAQPDEETLRLVYADWLQERNDPRAEFLRQESELTRVRQEIDFLSQELTLQDPVNKEYARFQHLFLLEESEVALRERLAQHKPVISPLWLRWIDRTRIENCRIRFDYLCPKQWSQLTLTDDVRVRHCEQCNRGVHFCESLTEARNHTEQGHCIAIVSTRAPGEVKETLGFAHVGPDLKDMPPPRKRLTHRELPHPLVEEIRREAIFYSQPSVTRLPLESGQPSEILEDRAAQHRTGIGSAIRRWLRL